MRENFRKLHLIFREFILYLFLLYYDFFGAILYFAFNPKLGSNIPFLLH